MAKVQKLEELPEAFRELEKMKPNDPESRKKKIASAKVMDKLGFSDRQIAKILGIGLGTAHRWTKDVSVEDWNEMELAIKMLVQAKEEQVAAKVLDRLERDMDKASYGHLIFLYKSLREIRQPKEGNTNNIRTVNVQVVRGSITTQPYSNIKPLNNSD